LNPFFVEAGSTAKARMPLQSLLRSKRSQAATRRVGQVSHLSSIPAWDARLRQDWHLRFVPGAKKSGNASTASSLLFR